MFGLLEFVLGMAAAAIMIGIGFWLGRRTLTLPVVEGKKYDPGKTPKVEYDPYNEALTGKKEEYTEDIK